MDFELPGELRQRLSELDDFIDREIRPLQEQDDNERFFDHRREFSRTDVEAGGTPSREWEELLGEMFRRADRAGWLRYGLPEEAGGRGGSNLDMAVIREHLAAKGLGLHNDLQNESSVVGNFPFVQMFLAFGTPEQKAEFVEGMITHTKRVAFGLTEPDHGSDATWLETTAVADGGDWILNGAKRFNSGLHSATHDVIFARTSGEPGDARGVTAFIVPTDTPGFSVDFHWWTFNMPTDHAEVSLRDVRVPGSAVFGEVGGGLALAQHFVHENRIRQAASGVGAAQYCIDRSVRYARERITFGQPLASRQAVQWPLVELQTDAELVRTLVRKTAWELDRTDHMAISDKVSMCNYRANRLVCEAADRAMQVHGGLGYTRHTPFEHIYRHHRRYRITEGSEEIQMRKVAGYLFGFAGPNKIPGEPGMTDFREIGSRLSNWGRWDTPEGRDERGTTNLITPDRIVEAATHIRAGKVFDLGIPFEADGPQPGGRRINPKLFVSESGADQHFPGAFRYADDYVVMPLQSASQWDALAHVFYDDQLYNGFPASSISPHGTKYCGIDKQAKGIAGRGVLLDVARHRGVDWMSGGEVITPEDLDATLAAQETEVQAGDIVLVRTGWRKKFLTDRDARAFTGSAPGLGLACCEWLSRHDVAAVCADNWAVEVVPGELDGEVLPVHMILIRDMGMTLGEILDFEELSEDCAADSRYTFFFCAPPIKFRGAFGSPTNPLAIK